MYPALVKYLLHVHAKDFARRDDVRQGAKRQDVHRGETSRVSRTNRRLRRFSHRVRGGATVVLLHGRRKPKSAGEQQRRGVEHDNVVHVGA